jgi:hypothetical protein
MNSYILYIEKLNIDQQTDKNSKIQIYEWTEPLVGPVNILILENKKIKSITIYTNANMAVITNIITKQTIGIIYQSDIYSIIDFNSGNLIGEMDPETKKITSDNDELIKIIDSNTGKINPNIGKIFTTIDPVNFVNYNKNDRFFINKNLNKELDEDAKDIYIYYDGSSHYKPLIPNLEQPEPKSEQPVPIPKPEPNLEPRFINKKEKNYLKTFFKYLNSKLKSFRTKNIPTPIPNPNQQPVPEPVPEPPVPEPVPEQPVPESPVPKPPVPKPPVPESPVPESPVPESPVPESPVPESPVPEPPVPKPVPESPVPVPKPQESTGPFYPPILNPNFTTPITATPITATPIATPITKPSTATPITKPITTTSILSQDKSTNKSTKLPNSLIIYIKTRIPNFYNLTYQPSMTVPNNKSNIVYLDPLVKYYENPISTIPLNAPKDLLYTQFYEASEFDTMINKILSDFRYMQKPRTFEESCDEHIIENNIKITVNTLFKPNNVFYINNNPYTIVETHSNPSNWQINKKPLEQLLNQFSHLSYDQLEKESTTEVNAIPEILRQGNIASSNISNEENMLVVTSKLTEAIKTQNSNLNNLNTANKIPSFIPYEKLPGIDKNIQKLYSRYLRQNFPINYFETPDKSRDLLTISLLINLDNLLEFINTNKKMGRAYNLVFDVRRLIYVMLCFFKN